VRLNKLLRSYRKLRAGPFRLRVLLPIGAVTILAAALMYGARGMGDYRRNAFMEVGGDLIGAMIIVVILTPLIARAREGRIRERGRLDFDLFTDNLAAATSVIKILDTYSNLFDRPQTPQALSALEQAMERHTWVQILLLHPDSTAAAVRAEEIHRGTIRREILRNVRVLSEFTDRIDPKNAQRLEVRLYRAAASTTLYRWDDRAMISFLSLGRHTSQGNQLEIDVDTSLGHFVEQHFAELWEEATPLADYLRLRVRLTDDLDEGARDFALPYVVIEDVHYFADPQVLAHLARVHATGRSVTATVADRPGEQLQLEVVDDDDEAHRETLTSHFREKYGWPGQAFLYLVSESAPRRTRRLRRL
jgi:hypothetical protein